MAKTPESKSNKTPAKSNKKKSERKKKPPHVKAAPKVSGEELPPAPCECDPCAPCAELETGVWGLMYRDAAGTCRCLPFDGTGAKYLKADENGPYWANS